MTFKTHCQSFNQGIHKEYILKCLLCFLFKNIVFFGRVGGEFILALQKYGTIKIWYKNIKFWIGCYQHALVVWYDWNIYFLLFTVKDETLCLNIMGTKTLGLVTKYWKSGWFAKVLSWSHNKRHKNLGLIALGPSIC